MAAIGAGLAVPIRFIAYERVSTARQGASGLGLEAQRQSIDAFAASRSAEVLARFTEVESGRNPDRPELAMTSAFRDAANASMLWRCASNPSPLTPCRAVETRS